MQCSNRECGAVSWRIVFIILVACVGIALTALVTFGYFNKLRPAKDLNVCSGNLMRIERALKEYWPDNQELYPPLSSQPGVLMFSPKSLPPTAQVDPLWLTCPTLRYAKKGQASGRSASPFDDQSYFYLGYAVLNDDAVEAFAKAYRKRIAEGGDFNEDLVVEGDGVKQVLHRLSFSVDKRLRAEGGRFSMSPNTGVAQDQNSAFTASDDVPVLIERDLGHVDADSDGRPRGAWVLFLHGGVKFVKSGTWPITEKTQRILAELGEYAP